MSSTQELYNSESFCLVRSLLDRLSWAERERLVCEINAKHESEKKQHQSKHTSLTKRESQVLTLIAHGYTRKEVGSALKISHNTASTHVSKIYEKLDISTIAEATHVAMRLGIIKLIPSSENLSAR